jgi:hypothetical protein
VSLLLLLFLRFLCEGITASERERAEGQAKERARRLEQHEATLVVVVDDGGSGSGCLLRTS